MSFFALTIAGSDCSGGAGIQADLKTFCKMGVYGMSAVTSVVVENAARVKRIFPLTPDLVSDQIQLCFETAELEYVKTGMLPSRGIVEAVVQEVSTRKVKAVVDPVMVASVGTRLISEQAILTMKKLLLPLCFVMTPNLNEAAFLLGCGQIHESLLTDYATKLADMFGCAVFLKGGHLPGKVAKDVLVFEQGRETYESEKVLGVNTHGTGCTLSAALTAALARGENLPAACASAKNFVTEALRRSVQTKIAKVLHH